MAFETNKHMATKKITESKSKWNQEGAEETQIREANLSIHPHLHLHNHSHPRLDAEKGERGSLGIEKRPLRHYQ